MGDEIPSNRELFKHWFWGSTQGNELIRDLNKFAQEKGLPDRIRREKERPVIYAIVINDRSFLNNYQVFKYVKVGFTHIEITPGSGNRMEKIQKALIANGYNNAKTLFVLPIGCVDTTRFGNTESRIRGKVGTSVSPQRAKDLNLPVPTEWVFTSQNHLELILYKIDEGKRGFSDLIDIFKDLQGPPVIPEELKCCID